MSSEYRASTHSHSAHHRYRRRRRGPSGLMILLIAAAVFIVIVLIVSFLGQKPESRGGVTQPSDTPAPTETASTRFCIGYAKDTAVNASWLHCATKILSTTLYMD